ncbi:uncharacterized protein LOC142607567 [Castanea sativa]|uniref:uncharacterized protein LOC142607567 n=1 Tax=Castanea sativa TaxID=21020 RepID=UPI003F64F897
MYAEFQASQFAPEAQFRPSCHHKCCWKAPHPELVKINSDGAIFPNLNKAGIGVVIRDNKGLILASCSKKLPKAYSGEEIEALAAALALSFASDIGFSRAFLEGDLWTVYRALMGDDYSMASFGLLIKDAKFEAQKF